MINAIASQNIDLSSVTTLWCVKLIHIISSTCFDRPLEEWLFVDVGVSLVTRIKNCWSLYLHHVDQNYSSWRRPRGLPEHVEDMMCIGPPNTGVLLKELLTLRCECYSVRLFNTVDKCCVGPGRRKQQEMERNTHIVRSVIATPCQILWLKSSSKGEYNGWGM